MYIISPALCNYFLFFTVYLFISFNIRIRKLGEWAFKNILFIGQIIVSLSAPSL